jgi:hypothetical protein
VGDSAIQCQLRDGPFPSRVHTHVRRDGHAGSKRQRKENKQLQQPAEEPTRHKDDLFNSFQLEIVFASLLLVDVAATKQSVCGKWGKMDGNCVMDFLNQPIITSGDD